MKTIELFSAKASGLFLLCILLLSGTSLPPASPAPEELEGAWRMVMTRDQPVSSLGLEMVKILVDGHFMFAFYHEESQRFFSAGGGTYSYKNGVYTEQIAFHTITPALVGRKLPFQARLGEGRWHHTGDIDGQPMNEVFERIDAGSAARLAGAWEAEALREAALPWQPVRKKDIQTWKLVMDGRFAEVSFRPGSGELVACSGGVVKAGDTWVDQQIAFHMKDSVLVGTTIRYDGLPSGASWETQAQLTRGQDTHVSVRWLRKD